MDKDTAAMVPGSLDERFTRNKKWVVEKISPMAVLSNFFYLYPSRVWFYDEDTKGHYGYGSRPHRKHRYLRFIPEQLAGTEIVVPPVPKIFMLDVANISWWIAIIFCLGTVCWVVSGHIFMWPFPNLTAAEYAIGYIELAGILLFDVGCYLLVLEALNEDFDLTCGVQIYEMKGQKIMSGTKNGSLEHLQCTDEHALKNGVLCRNKQKEYVDRYIDLKENSKNCTMSKLYAYIPNKKRVDWTQDVATEAPLSADACTCVRPKWRWWGWDFHYVGYTAAFLLAFGCFLFTIAVITALPGVVDEGQWQVQQALIWAPQTIGSACFVLSGLLYTLEEQDVWYLPALNRIGWHASFFNLLGGIGFLLSSIFGYLANWKGNGPVCCQFWGTAFNAFYGNWAFMVGSLLLLLEVENKDPISLYEYLLAGRAWVTSRLRSLKSNGEPGG